MILSCVAKYIILLSSCYWSIFFSGGKRRPKLWVYFSHVTRSLDIGSAGLVQLLKDHWGSRLLPFTFSAILSKQNHHLMVIKWWCICRHCIWYLTQQEGAKGQRAHASLVYPSHKVFPEFSLASWDTCSLLPNQSLGWGENEGRAATRCNSD